MTTPRIAFRSLCGVLLTGLVPLAAQSAASLDREIEFVRKLASDLGFVSLAKTQIETLQKQFRGADEAKKVRQLGIDISLLGARADSRPEERRRLFKDAVDASREFVQTYGDDPVADQARRTLLEASFDYGRFLVDELEVSAEAAPEKIKELRANALDVFQGGIDAADQVMKRLESKRHEEGSAAQRDYYVSWLYKAMLEREAAGVAPEEDRKTRTGIARDTFEGLILDVGEETLLGQRAWFEMSKLGEVLGNLDDAYRDYAATIDTIKTSLDSKDIELPEEIRESMINLMQEAYDRGAETLFAQGRIEETLAFCQQFREMLKKYGAENTDVFEIADPRFGHPVFLVEARAMAESGKPEMLAQALDQVRKINDQHPSDMIGVRAKSALRQILEGGATVSGALLFEVAKGAQQERDYERAIRSYKRAFGAMTADEKKTLGIETWKAIGECSGVQKRYLEATLAMVKGLEDFGALGDPTAEAMTDRMNQAWGLFKRDAKEMTPELTKLDERVTALGKFGGAGSEAKTFFTNAQKALNDNKYAEAADLFAKVPKDTPYYEPAQSMIPQAWQRAGDFKKARAAIKAYQDWTGTPEAKLDKRELIATRENSLATVEFWNCYIDYLEANGANGGTADPTKFDGIISAMQRFVDDRGKRQGDLAARCYDMMARMNAALGRINKAEELYRTLNTADANSPLVAPLATAIFKAHWDSVKALDTEREALLKRKAPDNEVTDVERRLTTARRAAVTMVAEYADGSNAPSFEILYAGVNIGKDLGDWPTVERLGRKCIDNYSSDAKRKDDVQKWILPAVGEALMRQGGSKFADAVKMLTAAAEAKPDDYPLKRLLALAKGGWFEFDQKGNMVEVLGMDDPVPAWELYWVEYKKYALNPARGVEPYSLEWYQFHLEAFMIAKRASRKDSTYGTYATSVFNTAQGRAGEKFGGLKALGSDGAKILDMFRAVNAMR